MKAFRFLAVVLLVLVLLPPAARSAAEEHGEAGHESGGSGFIWKVVNFAVLFGAMFFFLRKPLGAMLAKRVDVVREVLEDARQDREKAEAKLAEAQARAAALENEASRLKEQAAVEGREETKRIRALAVRETERIKTLASQEVAFQLQAGIRDLKEYTAELAAGLAEERIKKRLTQSDQSDLIDRSIERLKEIREA
ncbi:MAG: ATP synthase F0 subunit B [Candidatus Aminicenantes bacterium]|nr:ATP synthase F0 subunit B [Candidatus Aminicenantes bacterium]